MHIRLTILSDACDIIFLALLLFLAKNQAIAFSQSVDRPFADTSSCIVCTAALPMVSVCVWERMCLGMLLCTWIADTCCGCVAAGEDTLRMDSPPKRSHHSSKVSSACPALPSARMLALNVLSHSVMLVCLLLCGQLRARALCAGILQTVRRVGRC